MGPVHCGARGIRGPLNKGDVNTTFNSATQLGLLTIEDDDDNSNGPNLKTTLGRVSFAKIEKEEEIIPDDICVYQAELDM